MKRFVVYVRFFNTDVERAIAEGVEFNNENIALHEFLTKTILVINSIKEISKHYSAIGDVVIEWLDYDEFYNRIH
jgi:hypothetical protein